ncbi:IS3 family transposase [Gordonia sp. VNQ95]|uniref:IS3 family transposase n=1 Tax=Gordonia sp. VNQ95 TaxID=3156619 RepID=UPI0032B389EB
MDFIRTYQGHRVGADGLIWGVDSMCTVLSEHGWRIAPSTYYDHINRGPSVRMLTDAQVIDAIFMLRKNKPLTRVLGTRKTWIMLRGTGLDVARCTVERVMREMGWHGAIKKKRVRTTIPDAAAKRPTDLVDRQFYAAAPNRLWVADFTYCRTESGWVYTAFVTDVFARKIVGWKVATEMTVNLVTDAISNAIYCRKRCGVVDLSKLVHHSDAGSQYTAIVFGQRLAEDGIAAGVSPVNRSGLF